MPRTTVSGTSSIDTKVETNRDPSGNITNITNTTNTNTITSLSDDSKNSNNTSVSVDCSGGNTCVRCSSGSCSTFPNMYVTGSPSNTSNAGTVIGVIIFIIVLFILIGACFYFRKRIMNLFKKH